MIKEIYDLVQYIVNKDTRGLSFTPEQLNTLFPMVSYEMLNTEVAKLFPTQYTPVGNDVITQSVILPFVTTVSVSSPFGVPNDYVRWCSMSSGGRRVTPVSSLEYAKAQDNVYARPDIEPIVKRVGNSFVPLPTNLSTLTIDYIKKPVEPYYDYCQDSVTYDPIFMPVGSSIVGTDLKLGSTVLHSGVIKDGVTLPYASQTVEPEWEDKALPELVARILSKAGVNLSAVEVSQYAEQKIKDA